jgi:FtsP/CotA-like multicopper oxidase with cupredoxin domain/Ca2+-binding RTX toxin-like protein
MTFVVGGLALAVLTVAPVAEANHPAPFAKPLNIPSGLTGSSITLTAQESNVPIFDGTPTRMWTYNGTFPGPTIRQTTGQPTQVTLVNNLSAAGNLTLHNHGNHSAPQYDGQPHSFLVPPGGSRTYLYEGTEGGGNERGAPQWYHDHHMDVTGRNTWMGLAGFYIIDDPADPTSLPSGEFDVPLMLLDRSFDPLNQISYVFDQNGVTGDHILANGVPQPYFDVGDRRYRFRILNASNSSDYELVLSNGQSMNQIGTDSGLLPAPVQRQRIRLGPAERADVVINFGGPLGRQIVLRNTLGSGATRDVMQFRVNRDLTDSTPVPASLRPQDNLGTPRVTRTFDFARSGGRWTINGLPFDPNRVDARPVLDTTEKWILTNTSDSSHVIHVHDVDQQLISRNGQPPPPYELTKESWNIGPGETVEVLIRFTDHLGKYVFHCHILEHEDDSMMAQFEVVPPPTPSRIVAVKDAVPNDPQDFSFTAGGGLSPASFQLDDDGDNANALSNTRTFDNLAPGSGYSISEAVPSGWIQLSATCDSGDSVSNISVSAGETVTCTFTNRTVADPCQGVPLWPGATSGNDSVSGTAGDDVIFTGNGADTIYGLGGNDTICGGNGIDRLGGGRGNDYLDGGAGATDTANALDYRQAAEPVTVDLQLGQATGDGTDTLVNRFREVDGSRYGDTISGGAAGERLNGRAGPDTLAGRAGNDTLNGNDGNDSLESGTGADPMSGGPGTDTATYATRTSAVAVDIDGVADDGEVGEGDNVKTDVENVAGGTGPDSLTGNAATDNTLNGGNGADTLRGLGGTDTASYAGRSTPVTVAINNVADDGDASDGPAGARDNVMTDVENLTGGAGADTLSGSAARNSLDGGNGADVLSGLGNADTVTYAIRATAVTVDIDNVADDGNASDGSAGARDNVMTDVENLIGGKRGDDLTGSSAINNLTGGLGADTLRGLAGNDALFANDDIVDAALDCGLGTDSAHVDPADPAAIGCESVGP